MTESRQRLIDWLAAALDAHSALFREPTPDYHAAVILEAGEKADPDTLADLLGNSEDAATGRAIRELPEGWSVTRGPYVNDDDSDWWGRAS